MPAVLNGNGEIIVEANSFEELLEKFVEALNNDGELGMYEVFDIDYTNNP